MGLETTSAVKEGTASGPVALGWCNTNVDFAPAPLKAEHANTALWADLHGILVVVRG